MSLILPLLIIALALLTTTIGERHNVSQRVGIEWALARACTDFAFVDQCMLQKVQLTQVSKYYYLAALLSNCYTCVLRTGTVRHRRLQNTFKWTISFYSTFVHI